MQITVSKPKGTLAAPSIVTSALSQLSAASVLGPIRIRANAVEGPFTKVRPISNLKPDPSLVLAKGGKKNGALYFYNNFVKQGSPKIGFLIYAALAYSIYQPDVHQIIPDRAKLKKFKEFWGNINKSWTGNQVSALVRVKKESDHFTVKAPIFQGGEEILHRLGDFFTNLSLDDLSKLPQSNLDAGFIPAANIKDSGSWFSPHLARLKAIPGAGIEVTKNGNRITFFLVLQFNQSEAEFLCQIGWAELRPLDFYGLMRAWVDGRYGLISSPPECGIPLHKIASSMPKGGEPRTSDMNILVDENADYWYLPKEHDKVSQFDSESSRFLTRDDGTFGWPRAEDGVPAAKPPGSQLVFVDWVNLKLAYSDTQGKLHVKALDRTVPSNASHYRRILNTKLASDLGSNILTQVNNIAGVLKADLAMSFGKPDALIINILKLPAHEGEQVQDITFQDLWNAQGSLVEAKNFWKCLENVLTYADTSIEVLYTRYAFTTVSNLVAYCKILNTFCPKYEDVVAEDNERRKAYINQGLAPDFELDSVPFMAEGMGLQPHQVRNANRLKDSPKFAILAVDAGGGKTASCIYDCLKEMNKGNVRRALILCPSHLVAQYVKEFVFFTHGRVNVIATTVYTIRRHGLDGLAKMIQNAPSNTVVVCDYDLARGKTKASSIGYGTAVTKTFALVEMLRQFAFDYVFCDESHMLKGATTRQAAVSRLISDIPMKRLASGTLTPNAVTDLVKQINLMDPTILPEKEFINKYALEVRGDKVVKWKEGYEKELMADLKSNVVWCQAKRKEWAAFLPTLLEKVHDVDLSPRQQEVYNTILNEVVDKIEQEAKNSKALAKALSGKLDEENSEDVDEDDEPIDIDKLLKPFLQRIEQFLSAPGSDVFGSKVLHGDDLLSPKILKIVEICREHLSRNEPGKILIFTNYKESANTIYEMMPPDLKAATIHYEAENKAACVAEFDRNDRKKIMVGVEISMNTGLNLQAASRLIRVDSVWTPGSLEQGNSRIQRPNVKVAETRNRIYLDWVVCNNSIDITKMSYLFAKQVMISKWEEAGNPKYEQIEAPRLFAMSLDVIRESNSQNGEDLAPYFSSYREVKQVQFQEYKEYAANNPGDKNPDGTVRRDPIIRAPNLPGSALMTRIPYVPGTELYKAEDLGLIRYDAYMGLNAADLEEDSDDEGEEDLSQREKSRAEFDKLVEDGAQIHTEFGDGTIKSVGSKAINVLVNGSVVRVQKLAAFIITRAQTNNQDMRNLLLKQISEESGIEYKTPYVVSVKEARSVKIPQLAPKVADVLSVSLELSVMNDFVGFMMTNADDNPAGARVLEALGFEQPVAYAYAEMKTAKMMYAQFVKWKQAGFNIKQEFNQACKNTYLALETRRKNAATMVGLATQADLRNFFRIERKPIADRMTLCPYPLIIDDVLYIALPLQGHPGSVNGMKVKATGVRWMKSKVEAQRVIYFPSLQRLDQFVPKLLNQQGLQVANLKELIATRKRLHKRASVLIKGLQK